jgi:hypothetical protein
MREKRSTWIGGGQESQTEKDDKIHVQAQVDQVRLEGIQRRQRGQDAILQLAFAREQLLAMSVLMYGLARDEERAGRYEIVDILHEVARMARNIRANQTVDRLSKVGEP